MPRTTQCTNCGVALNLPDNAVGKRLKCPQCGTKFHATAADARAPSGEPSAHDASPDSSQDIRTKRRDDDLLVPTSALDLRETFDLPMMTDAAVSATAKAPARPTGDALALFESTTKPSTRRPTGAEARAKARRCPTCGAVIPAGMSLCNTCGLDLDTGTRIDLIDDLAPPPPPRSEGLPLGMMLVGGVCFLGSLVGTCAALYQTVSAVAGWIYFVPVGLFALFAATQFLRAKSVKMLLAALTLGVFLNVIGLIVMPIVKVTVVEPVKVERVIDDDPDSAGEIIHDPAKDLDMGRVFTGIALLLVYAAVSVYLISPPVSRQFQKK